MLICGVFSFQSIQQFVLLLVLYILGVLCWACYGLLAVLDVDDGTGPETMQSANARCVRPFT